MAACFVQPKVNFPDELKQIRDKNGTLSMANTASAKKAVRTIARRTSVNKTKRTRMRSSIRATEEAIASGDKKAAAEALKIAQPLIMKAVSSGILKKNTAARKVSRLAAKVKAVSA